MRKLTELFEGLLDTDYDIDDDAIMDDVLKKAIGSNGSYWPTVKTNGEWIEFDCSTNDREIWFKTIDPIIKAGYSKFKFINCDRVELVDYYAPNGTSYSDIEIDAPESPIFISDNERSLTLTNVKINAKNIKIDGTDSTEMKITMKGCKFDVAYIKFQAVTQLSISDTCKFTNCKLLYLGRVGKSVANKANKLNMGSLTSGTTFENQIKTFEVPDNLLPEYWDIDVMKTLSLKANKWPDLGKIVIVPNGIPAVSAPGLCLYKSNKGMIPVSKRTNRTTIEFKDGWYGTHVSRAKTELNCVTK